MEQQSLPDDDVAESLWRMLGNSIPLLRFDIHCQPWRVH